MIGGYRERLTCDDRYPTVSALLLRLVRSLRALGLLSSYYGIARHVSTDAFAESTQPHLFVTKAVLEVLEQLAGARLSGAETPFVSNRLSWSCSSLGGYATSEVDVRASEVVTSYFRHWFGAHQSVEAVGSSFLFAVFDRVRATKDVRSGLEYAFDLHDAGFILRREVLITLVDTLLAAHVRVPDAARRVAGLPAGLPEAALSALFQEIDSRAPDDRRVAEAYGWLWDRHDAAVEAARAAPGAGEQLLSWASLSGVIEALERFEHRYRGRLPETLALKAMRSFREENAADVGGAARTVFLWSRYRPVRPNISVYAVLWRQYAEHFGRSWVEKLHEDRLVIPDTLVPFFDDHLRDAMVDRARGREREVPWPAQWTTFSPDLAPFFATLLQRPFLTMRSRRFPAAVVQERLRAWAADRPAARWSEDERAAVVDKEYNGTFSLPLLDRLPKYDAEEVEGALEDIHGVLCQEELRARLLPLVGDYESLSQLERRRRIAALRELGELYPWLSPIHHELAILHDFSGELDLGIDDVSRAILLTPDSADAWKSLGVLLGRAGRAEERNLCHAVAHMLREGRAKREGSS